jgi:hypothetical protein
LLLLHPLVERGEFPTSCEEKSVSTYLLSLFVV